MKYSRSYERYLALQMIFFILGYDSNRTDHEKMLCRVLQICRKEKLKLYKHKCNFRCTSVPYLGKIYLQERCETSSKKTEVDDRYATTKVKEGVPSIHGNNEIHWQVFTSNSRSMCTTMMNKICKDRKDIEPKLPEPIWQSKDTGRKICMYKV